MIEKMGKTPYILLEERDLGHNGGTAEGRRGRDREGTQSMLPEETARVLEPGEGLDLSREERVLADSYEQHR